MSDGGAVYGPSFGTGTAVALWGVVRESFCTWSVATLRSLYVELSIDINLYIGEPLRARYNALIYNMLLYKIGPLEGPFIYALIMLLYISRALRALI